MIFFLLLLSAAGVRGAPPDLARAQALAAAGEVEAAVRAYRVALDATPPSSRDRAAILDALSAVETDSGDYAAAVADATGAAQLYESFGDRRAASSALNQAGLAQTYAGDYAAADRSLRAALVASIAARDPEMQVEQSTNLGNVDFYLGRYADAAARYDVAQRLIEENRASAWSQRRRGILLANRATLDQRLGRYEEALRAYREARGAADLRPGEQAQLLVNLGVVYRRLGDPYKALAAYDEGLSLFERDHQLDAELGALKNRGIVLALDLGRLDEARRTFDQALARATAAGDGREMLQARLYRAEATLRLSAKASSDRGGARLLAERAASEFREVHAQAVRLETVEEQWKSLYGLARAELALGDEVAATRQLREAISVVEKIREGIRIPSLRSDFFNDKRDVYDALIALRLRHGAAAAEVFDLVERVHSRAWRERLGLHGKTTLDALQKTLPPRVLLLDYWSSPGGAAVVSITRDVARVQAIKVDDAAIRELVEQLARGPGSEWNPAAARIAAQVLPSFSRDVRHVIVVADGPLVTLPFELLGASGRLLLERYDVTYMPTAAMLSRPSAPRRSLSSPWALQLRAFADPLFTAAALDPSRRSTRLLASAREVRDIERELGGKAELHVGADDLKRHLFEAGSAPILHLATHAFVDGAVPEQSRILFSPPVRRGSADYLFLKEAYDLPLQNVELAVLSACDTERGAMTRGEGVQSFSRAFLAAGARSTVTTLWRVPDQTTAEFMRLFYHHLQRGDSRAEALRRAKLRFVQSNSELSDPHYWAAFVLTGDGLSPVPRALRWQTVFVAAAALLALLLGAWAAMRRFLG